MNDDEVLAAARAALTHMRESLDDVRMEHPVAAVVARARARQRRRWRSGATAVGSVLAVSSLLLWTGLVPGGNGARPGSTITQARTVAYVVGRVSSALSNQKMVYRGSMASTDGPVVSWAYGSRSKFVEFTGTACRHALPSGWCTRRGGSERYLAAGTALIKGKLTGAYVTYYNHKFSLSPITAPPPMSACSTTVRLAMAGPIAPGDRWSTFINGTLACGAAEVTGHVRINGAETTRITGKPTTVQLSSGYAKDVQEKWARVAWTLYVNSTTYLPVRIVGSTATYGGPAPSTLNSAVTDVQWLPPTPANIAQTLVTVPPGYRQVSSPANQ